MARRYPVTTTAPGGISPFRAIAPPNGIGDRYQSALNLPAYNQAATTTLFSRTRFTVGVLFKQVLFYPETYVTSPNNNNGNLLRFQLGGGSSGGGNFTFSQREIGYAHYDAQISTYSAGSNGTSGGATGTELGPSQQEGLILNTMVCDDDAYPDSSWFMNNRRQGSTGPALNWASNGSGDGEFELGRSSWHHIVGWFYHLDAMSFEEIYALSLNIMQTKDIPTQDFTGFGTALDHIWSVKRAMQVGTNGITNWTSDGAVGGETIVRQDANLNVIEFEADWADVR